MNDKNLPSCDDAGSTPAATTRSRPVPTATEWIAPGFGSWKCGEFVEYTSLPSPDHESE
jgi:hypothetical protein